MQIYICMCMHLKAFPTASALCARGWAPARCGRAGDAAPASQLGAGALLVLSQLGVSGLHLLRRLQQCSCGQFEN